MHDGFHVRLALSYVFNGTILHELLVHDDDGLLRVS